LTLGDSPEEATFRAEVCEWLERNCEWAPRLDPAPSKEQLAAWKAWSCELHSAGYAGITWPREYGGRGLPLSHQAIWLQERARAEVLDHIGVIGLGMAGPTIMHWGSAEQQQRFLPPLLRSDEIWCQGFSEPDSGSDLASVRTRAIADGDDWIVDGQKVWSSFAHFADWCILLVRTDPRAAKHAGLSYLLLDMRLPGVEVVPLPQITGDPEFNEIFLHEVRVPRSSMLGSPGDGWKIAMTTLSHERATHGIGLAAQLDSDLAAAVRRLNKICPSPLEDQTIVDELASLWVDLEALKVTNLRLLSRMARADMPGPESTVSKLHWSGLNQRLTSLMGRVLGLEGLEEGPRALDGGRWSFARLRSRGNSIEAGTSEVLRNIIAERVLGLPRG
jgi:alkylation response protein AidB-like acyl-CoA dehydrogenase